MESPLYLKKNNVGQRSFLLTTNFVQRSIFRISIFGYRTLKSFPFFSLLSRRGPDQLRLLREGVHEPVLVQVPREGDAQLSGDGGAVLRVQVAPEGRAHHHRDQALGAPARAAPGPGMHVPGTDQEKKDVGLARSTVMQLLEEGKIIHF